MIINTITTLTDKMRERVEPLLEELKVELPNIFVFETYRTKYRQAQLYGLGRTYGQMMWAYPYNPAYWKLAQPLVARRTWTIYSKHMIGEAVDFAFKIDGKTTWSVKQKHWDKLVEIGKKYGLKSLAPREYAHLELDHSLTPLKVPEPFIIPEWAEPTIKDAKAAEIETDMNTTIGDMKVYHFLAIVRKLVIYLIKKLK